MAYEIALIIAFIGIAAVMLYIASLFKDFIPLMLLFIGLSLLFLISINGMVLRIINVEMHDAATTAAMNISLENVLGIAEADYTLLIWVFRIFGFCVIIYILYLVYMAFVNLRKNKLLMLEKASHEEE